MENWEILRKFLERRRIVIEHKRYTNLVKVVGDMEDHTPVMNVIESMDNDFGFETYITDVAEYYIYGSSIYRVSDDFYMMFIKNEYIDMFKEKLLLYAYGSEVIDTSDINAIPDLIKHVKIEFENDPFELRSDAVKQKEIVSQLTDNRIKEILMEKLFNKVRENEPTGIL